MTQPKWKCVSSTDYSRVEMDETGLYAPEMEISQDIGKGFLEVYRFSLDRLKEVGGFLVPMAYRNDTWPGTLLHYEPWFVSSLPSVERSCGYEPGHLRALLCSDEVSDRAWAYEDIGSYHGFINLDSDPLRLTEEQLDERWAR